MDYESSVLSVPNYRREVITIRLLGGSVGRRQWRPYSCKYSKLLLKSREVTVNLDKIIVNFKLEQHFGRTERNLNHRLIAFYETFVLRMFRMFASSNAALNIFFQLGCAAFVSSIINFALRPNKL